MTEAVRGICIKLSRLRPRGKALLRVKLNQHRYCLRRPPQKGRCLAFSVPGQGTNDTAEAALVVGALREDRGLCCSCSTVHVACKLHGPSLRGTLVEFACSRPPRRSSWYPWLSELKKWWTEEKRTKSKANTRVFTKFCIRPRQKLHRREGRIITQTMVTLRTESHVDQQNNKNVRKQNLKPARRW